MKTIFKRLSFFVGALALAALNTGCVSQIDTGNVGVTKIGGTYNQTEIGAGWTWTGFSTVYEVSGRENPITFDDMKPRTLDQVQTTEMDVDFYVKINPAKAAESMTRFAGDVTQNKDGDYIPGFGYITRMLREIAYESVGQIKHESLQKERGTLPEAMRKAAQAKIDKTLGEGWFTVTNVNLRNLAGDRQLEDAQRAATQQLYENQKKDALVDGARKDAERARVIAQGEADAARIKAEGLRSAGGTEYLRLLELQNQAAAIAKWNGVGPATVVGSGASPLINLPK